MAPAPELDDRIARLRLKLAAPVVTGTPVDRGSILVDLGDALTERHKEGDADDADAEKLALLNDAVDALTEARKLLPTSDSRCSAIPLKLGRLLTLRYVRHHTASADRDAAIQLLEQVATEPEVDPKDRLMLGQLLLLRMIPEPFLALLRGTTSGTSTDVTDPSMVSAAIQATAAPSDLQTRMDAEAAITQLTLAVESPSLPKELQGVAKGLLGSAMMMRGLVGESSQDVEHGSIVALLTEAADQWPADLPGEEGFASLAALVDAGWPLGAADLPAAGSPAAGQFVTALLNLTDTLSPGNPGRVIVLNGLGNMMAREAGLGSEEHLAQLYRLFGEDMVEVRDGRPYLTQIMRDSAFSLFGATAYMPTVDGADRAVAVANEFIGLSTEDAAAQIENQFLLSFAQLFRAFGSGTETGRAEAVQHLRAVAERIPPEHELAPSVLFTISGMLLERYSSHGVREDVDTALIYAESALAAASARSGAAMDDSDALFGRAMVLNLRALIGLDRFDMDEVETTVEEIESLINLLPDTHMLRSPLTVSHFVALLELGVHRGDWAQVNRACQLFIEMTETSASFPAIQPVVTSSSGMALILQGLLGEDMTKLDAGVDRIRGALADPSFFHGMKLGVHWGLGLAHDVRHFRTHAVADLEEAIDQLTLAWEHMAERPGVTSPADQLLWSLATERRTRDDAARDDPSQAVAIGIESLRAIVGEVLAQTDLDDALVTARMAAQRASQIAAWSLVDDGPVAAATALTALELGRGLVLHAATSATSTAELLETAGHPDLAAQWRESTRRSSTVKPGKRRFARDVETTPVSRRVDGTGAEAGAATRMVNILLGMGIPDDLRVRVLTALSHTTGPDSVPDRLLTPPSLPEIASALQICDADALVYLVPSDGVPPDGATPGYALLVGTDGTLESVELPGLTTAPGGTVDRYARCHRYAAGETAAPRDPATSADVDGRADASWRQALDGLCDWAWQAAIGPVLDRVTARGLGADGQPPRLVLVPCGTLGVVPWHAARIDQGDGRPRYACETAVFSYAATARQLVEVAGRPSRPSRLSRPSRPSRLSRPSRYRYPQRGARLAAGHAGNCRVHAAPGLSRPGAAGSDAVPLPPCRRRTR